MFITLDCCGEGGISHAVDARMPVVAPINFV